MAAKKDTSRKATDDVGASSKGAGAVADGIGENTYNAGRTSLERTPLQEALIGLLEARGWKQAQLSRKAGRGAGAVNDLLNHPERQPRPSTLRKLAVALGEPEDALLKLDRPIKSPQTYELTPDDLRGFDPLGLLGGWVGLLESDPERWAAWITPPAVPGPIVKALADVPSDPIALIDMSDRGRSGELVLVRSATAADGLRYVLEPYALGCMSSGELFFEVSSTAGVEVIGRVHALHRWC